MARAKTRKIRYLGPSPSASVVRPGDADLEFPLGEAVEIPEELANSLIEQPSFELVEIRGSGSAA